MLLTFAARVAFLVSAAAPALASMCYPCRNPYVRKEWRSLTNKEREKYIAAVKCLQTSPGTAPLAAVQNRYDDFIATHQAQTDFVHFVGIFYPFHRLLLAEYEKALWSCGWHRRLGQPYWDWTLDTATEASFLASPVFDTVRGFGSNGAFIPGNLSNIQLPGHIGGPPFDLPDRSGGGCVTDGPFAGMTTFLGPQNISTGTTPRCLRRDFSYHSLRDFAGLDKVQQAMNLPDFGHFELITDTTTFHPGGHWAVGGLYGTMTDTYVSPTDPIFWLHHSNMDRAWWSWQSRDLAKREKEISGPLIFFDYANEFGPNVTLTTPVWVGLNEDTRVDFEAGQLLHIRKGPFCYNYDHLY
ncbi:hypothetical protein V8F33_011685 [Rhypophila sp. PSN 637]